MAIKLPFGIKINLKRKEQVPPKIDLPKNLKLQPSSTVRSTSITPPQTAGASARLNLKPPTANPQVAKFVSNLTQPIKDFATGIRVSDTNPTGPLSSRNIAPNIGRRVFNPNTLQSAVARDLVTAPISTAEGAASFLITPLLDKQLTNIKGQKFTPREAIFGSPTRDESLLSPQGFSRKVTGPALRQTAEIAVLQGLGLLQSPTTAAQVGRVARFGIKSGIPQTTIRRLGTEVGKDAAALTLKNIFDRTVTGDSQDEGVKKTIMGAFSDAIFGTLVGVGLGASVGRFTNSELLNGIRSVKNFKDRVGVSLDRGIISEDLYPIFKEKFLDSVILGKPVNNPAFLEYQQALQRAGAEAYATHNPKVFESLLQRIPKAPPSYVAGLLGGSGSPTPPPNGILPFITPPGSPQSTVLGGITQTPQAIRTLADLTPEEIGLTPDVELPKPDTAVLRETVTNLQEQIPQLAGEAKDAAESVLSEATIKLANTIQNNKERVLDVSEEAIKAAVDVFKYSDNTYAVSVNLETPAGNVDTPFGGVFPSKEQAVAEGVGQVQKFIDDRIQLGDLDPTTVNKTLQATNKLLEKTVQEKKLSVDTEGMNIFLNDLEDGLRGAILTGDKSLQSTIKKEIKNLATQAVNLGVKLEPTPTKDLVKQVRATEKALNATAESAVRTSNVGNDPEVSQYKQTIRKAVQLFNANQERDLAGIGELISTKYPELSGLDEALNALANKGIQINTPADLKEIKFPTQPIQTTVAPTLRGQIEDVLATLRNEQGTDVIGLSQQLGYTKDGADFADAKKFLKDWLKKHRKEVATIRAEQRANKPTPQSTGPIPGAQVPPTPPAPPPAGAENTSPPEPIRNGQETLNDIRSMWKRAREASKSTFYDKIQKVGNVVKAEFGPVGKYYPLQQLQREYFELTGEEIPEANSPLVKAITSLGIIPGNQALAIQDLANIIKKADDLNLFDEFDDYLQLRAVKFAEENTLKEAEEMLKTGDSLEKEQAAKKIQIIKNREFSALGMTASEAESGLNALSQEIGADRFGELEGIAKEFFAFGKDNLDKLLMGDKWLSPDGGMIDQELYNTLLERGEGYSPQMVAEYFGDVLTGEAQVGPSGAKGSVYQNYIKRKTGSTKDVLKPTIAMMDRTVKLYRMLRLNHIRRALYNGLQGSPLVKDLETPVVPITTVSKVAEIDPVFMGRLSNFANKLGIKFRTSDKMRGGVLGYYVPSSQELVRRFASSPLTAVHELGHGIDSLYDLKKILFHPETQKELRKVADLREVRKAYGRKAEEKVAAFVSWFIANPSQTKDVAPNAYRLFDNFINQHPELAEIRGLGSPSLVQSVERVRKQVFGRVAGMKPDAPEGYKALNFIEDGKTKWFAVPEEVAELYESNQVQNLSTTIPGFITSFFNNLFKAGATGYNLSFAVVNLPTDAQRLATLSKYGIDGIKDVPGLALEVGRGVLTAAKGLDDATYREFLRSGVLYSTLQRNLTPEYFDELIDLERHPDKMKNDVNRLRKRTNKFNLVRGVVNLNAAFESANKIAGYQRFVKTQGIDNYDEAVAFELRRFAGSPDFSVLGTSAKLMSLAFPYFNPALRGITTDYDRVFNPIVTRVSDKARVKLLRTLPQQTKKSLGISKSAEEPRKYSASEEEKLKFLTKIVSRFLQTVVPLTILTWVIQKVRNPDYRKDLKDYERDGYWSIPISEKPEFNPETNQFQYKTITYPKRDPIGRLVANTVEALLDFAFDKDPEIVPRLLNNFFEVHWPFTYTESPDSGFLGNLFAGMLASGNSVFRVPAEIATNYDFFRRTPIVSDRFAKLPEEMQLKPSTSGLSTILAPRLGWSPLMMDHAINGFLGTAAADVLAILGTPVKDDPLSLEFAPVTRRFYKHFGGGLDQELNTQANQKLKELEQTYNAFQKLNKEGKKDQAAQLLKDNPYIVYYPQLRTLFNNLAERRNTAVTISQSVGVPKTSKEQFAQMVTEQNHDVIKNVSTTILNDVSVNNRSLRVGLRVAQASAAELYPGVSKTNQGQVSYKVLPVWYQYDQQTGKFVDSAGNEGPYAQNPPKDAKKNGGYVYEYQAGTDGIFVDEFGNTASFVKRTGTPTTSSGRVKISKKLISAAGKTVKISPQPSVSKRLSQIRTAPIKPLRLQRSQFTLPQNTERAPQIRQAQFKAPKILEKFKAQ